jgi:ABC-type transporter Mla subunit MlaD
MKDSRTNAAIAGTALVAAIMMAAALSYAIGKWSFGNSGTTYVLKFPNATGITPNAEVKFAGAPCGRVKELRLIAPKDQDQDPRTSLYNCIEVVIDVNKGVEIDNGVEASIKQDGIGIAPRYILLMPGPDHDSGPLADNSVVQGEMPFDLADLLQPAGEALTQAKVLINQLQPGLAKLSPMMDRLDKLTDELQPMIGHTGKLIDHADRLMTDGDSVIGTINTPDGRHNAKALTATLAQKPWRVMWGGSTVAPVPENQALESDKVIHAKPDVQVKPTDKAGPFSP